MLATARSRALDLKPWHWPPCEVEPNDTDSPGLEHRGISDSARLLRRLVASGLSKYEPSPIAALARAEAERIRQGPP